MAQKRTTVHNGGQHMPEVFGDVHFPDTWQVFIPPSDEAPPTEEAAHGRLRRHAKLVDPALDTDALAAVPEVLVVDGTPVARQVVTPTLSQMDFRPLLGGVSAAKGIDQPVDYGSCGRVVYVYIPFESPERQKVSLGFGADCWIQAWLDGDELLDERSDSWLAFPPSIWDRQVDAEVDAGSHLLVVKYIAGKGSNVLAVGGPHALRSGNRASILSDPFIYGDERWTDRALWIEPANKACVDIADRRELFVDDYMVDGLSGGACRRLHHPVPREVVFEFNRPWEGNYNACFEPCTLIDDGGRILLYYKASNFVGKGRAEDYFHSKRDHSRPEVSCLAVSDDGIHFERPSLGIADYPGEPDTNIVWTGMQNFTPFLDGNPNAAPDARFKAITKHPDGGLVAYASADGLKWRALSDKPCITEGKFDSQNLAFWSETRGCYVEYHRNVESSGPRCGIRGIMTSTSDDLVHWSEPEFVRYCDDRVEQLYTNCTLPCPRAPHLFIATPGRFVSTRQKILDHPDHAVSDTILMSSRDGVLFDRWEEGFIRPDTDPENWTDRNNFPAWGILQRTPTEMSIYWCEHNGYPGFRLRRGSLRTDGFASVHSGGAIGELLTRPFTFSGHALELNYATSAIGTLRVALCNEAGRPIPGFAFEDSDLIYGNEINHVAAWHGRSDVSQLAGQPVRLRIRLHDADLFSFRFATLC